MSIIPVSALPGNRSNASQGGRWGQLGSRDPWVSPTHGISRFFPHPRARFYHPPLPVSVHTQRSAPYFSGQQKDSLSQQAAFRHQVLDIIRIDATQGTPTNFAQFQASASTVPSRAPSVPLRCYLPEPDAPYPTPYQPVKIGRQPPVNGARAGHSNPHFTLPRESMEAGVPLRGGSFAFGSLVGGAYRRQKRKHSMGAGGRNRSGQWIKKAVKKPGALRRQLGIPKGQTIPTELLRRVVNSSKSSALLKKRAKLALTLRGSGVRKRHYKRTLVRKPNREPRANRRAPDFARAPAPPPNRRRLDRLAAVANLPPFDQRGGQYRQPYDNPDIPERAGDRLWQVNALPEPEYQQHPAPVNPPAWAEQPQTARSPPRTRIPFTVPEAAYLPRAMQTDATFKIWNQPADFQMPAVTGPPAHSSPVFQTLRFEQLGSTVQGAGYGGVGGSHGLSSHDEYLYSQTRDNELRRGMNVREAERVAAHAVNSRRRAEGRLVHSG